MKKALSTEEYNNRLFALMKSGDIEEVKRFRQEYSDCKIDIFRGAPKIPIKINGARSLDDDPF
jgi:hypothetical protein